MKKIDFNRDWLFYKAGGKEEAKLVQLPHDAMLYEKREAGNSAGLGYFPGGKYIYEKHWVVPEEYAGKTVLLEFEGVYRHASVLVNGKEAGYWAYGYTQFFIDLGQYLEAGKENTICVTADDSQQPNSRWYSGSGIYRKVNLWVGAKKCIKPESINIRTISIRPAVIEVAVDIDSDHELVTEILYQGDVVAVGKGAKAEITVPNAKLWDDEAPELYTARVMLLDENKNMLDEATEIFGIRSIEWNAKQGLMINGKTKKLRGGCIHHDNGVIGACAFSDAEERKIRIMKEAGFNAIRSAHNPCSKELLEACDKYGMYVMDETFDSWYIPKNTMDYSIDFEEWHERDIAAMVRKDFNHPSVILYSIGNEVIETAQEKGIALAGEMCGLIRGMDATRPVSCGISITQNIDEWKGNEAAKEQYMGGIEKKKEQKEERRTQADAGMQITPEVLAGVNRFMADLGRQNEEKANTQEAEDALHGVCRFLDIPGYNYGEEKCHYDKEHYPERVVVHSETHHTQLYEHWDLIQKNPHIIGDFMWVGWDHIGEAGIGALGYPSRGGIGFDKPYPYLTSGSGIIDITGFRHPESYWARMVWKLQEEPVIAVEPVERSGEPYMMTYWNDTEGISGWSWPGLEGHQATVRVYTTGKEVELILNERLMGRKEADKNMAVFEVPYEAGTLAAKIYDEENHRIAAAELVTAGSEEIILASTDKNEVSANGQELVYVDIALTDQNGIVHVYPDREIEVEVTGPGTLQGLGSGNIFTEDSFVSGTCHTFYGRALAVVRAGYETGEIAVRIRSGNLEKKIVINCKQGGGLWQ